MAEWLVEEGIGEVRAALVEDGRILAARVEWPASMAGVGGPLPWDVAAHHGLLAIDHLLRVYPDRRIVLLGYSGGCKVIHDWVDTRPKDRHRIIAAGKPFWFTVSRYSPSLGLAPRAHKPAIGTMTRRITT